MLWSTSVTEVWQDNGTGFVGMTGPFDANTTIDCQQSQQYLTAAAIGPWLDAWQIPTNEMPCYFFVFDAEQILDQSAYVVLKLVCLW